MVGLPARGKTYMARKLTRWDLFDNVRRFCRQKFLNSVWSNWVRFGYFLWRTVPQRKILEPFDRRLAAKATLIWWEVYHGYLYHFSINLQYLNSFRNGDNFFCRLLKLFLVIVLASLIKPLVHNPHLNSYRMAQHSCISLAHLQSNSSIIALLFPSPPKCTRVQGYCSHLVHCFWKMPAVLEFIS